MTGPFQYPDYNATLGVQSPLANSEWDTMLARRQQMVSDIENRLKLANTIRQADPSVGLTPGRDLAEADHTVNQHQQFGTNADGTPTQFQASQQPPHQSELNQLYGAADYWGIPNPQSIPAHALKNIIEAKRLGASATGIGAFSGMDQTDRDKITFGASVGLGVTQDLIEMAQHIPFIGHAIAANQTVQQSERYLSNMNEAVASGMTEDERTGYRIAHGLGGMLGYIVPGEGAWRLAGAAGRLGALGTAGSIGRFVTSPIARAAIQGGAATWLLEGGGDQSNQEAAIKVGMGAATAGAIGLVSEALPRVFEKVRSSFKTRTDPLNSADLDPAYDWGRKGETVDAEWYFEADHQMPGQQIPVERRLTAGTPEPGSDPMRPMAGYEGYDANGSPTRPPTAEQDYLNRQAQGLGPYSDTGPTPAMPFGSDPFTVDPTITHEPPTGDVPAHGTTPPPVHPETAQLIQQLTEQRDIARRALEVNPLTGLGSKTALERARGAVDADPALSWATFDGKQFKAVNDTHGHDVGDQVLKNFGRAIQQTQLEMGMAPRAFHQGGDEFAAVVPRENAQAFVDRVRELSYQKVGGVETHLDGYHAPEFAEADLALMANKRRATPVPTTNSDQTDLFAQYGGDAFPGIPLADRQSLYQPSGTAFRTGGPKPLITQGNKDINFAGTAADNILSPETTQTQVQTGATQPGTYWNLTGEQALSEASNLTKHATIMEGDLSHVAAEGQMDESDVAVSAMFTNPERINVIQGVGDAGQVVRKLMQGQVTGRIMPHQFRMVERNGQLDMLVSDGLPITNKRVAQYKEHGFFDGQQAVVNGRSVQVQRIDDEGRVRVYDPYSEQSYLVTHDQVLPGRTAGGDAKGLSEPGEKLYQSFKGMVEKYMVDETAKLPAGTKADPSWLSSETATQLPRLLNQYLDSAVGSSPLSRTAMESYFNIRRVQDYKTLAPEEVGDLHAINKELNVVRTAMPIEHVSTEDMALQKGFSYVPTPGERGGILVDRNTDLRVPVEDEEAAGTFLRSFNRDLPDYTPISDVPVEVAGSNPHAANPGNDLEPVLERGAEAEYTLAKNAADDLVARMESALTQPPASGGGGSGGAAPPRDFSIGGGGGQPQLPSGTPSLGQQFAEAARSRPQELYKVLQKFDSAWLNYMTPFRSVTLDLENQLKNIGVTQGTLWKHYNDIVTNVTRAHNEALPWQAEWADIMSQFRRKHLRNGTVTKIQEIASYQDQLVAMQKAGYNHDEIQAQKRISDFNDRFFQYLVDDPSYKMDASRYITGYMSHVRQRQGMPGISDPFAEGDGARLPMELKFFAEMAREGNMQFRQMDARSLGTKMIRAAMFKKNVGESYETMARAWSDPRIPQQFRDLTRDWLEVVRTGHNPNYDVMIQGARHFFNSMGLPITNGEMATLSNIAFGNMYRAQLGGRPDAIFRDSIQPFFTGVRIGFAPVVKAYNTLLTGGNTTREMIQRGLDGGWLEKGMAKVANADVFEHGINTPEGTQLLSDAQNSRRELLARVGDAVWAATPKSLRNGLQGSRLDPLHYYTRLGEVNRVVSGEAGYQLAASALADYQYNMGKLTRGEMKPVDGVMWIDTADRLMETLLKDSKARAYPQPIQDEFKRLVSGGNVTEAAYLLANEAANMQFRYGAKENPVGIRKMGNTGRAIMQFGTFTQQYVAQMAEMAAGPGVHPAEKVAMLARYGTVSAALGIASAYTGWNFGKWAWHQSTTFAGGPLFQSAQQGIQALTGAAAMAMGAAPTPAQRSAVEDYSRLTPGSVLGGIAATEFPYSSTLRTADKIGTVSNGANPVEGTARAIITGEGDLRSDFRQFKERQDDAIMDPNAAWRNTGRRPGESNVDYNRRMFELHRPPVPGAGAQ